MVLIACLYLSVCLSVCMCEAGARGFYAGGVDTAGAGGQEPRRRGAQYERALVSISHDI